MFIEELAVNTQIRLNFFNNINLFESFADKKVLDVGCGTGFFTDKIYPFAKEVYGIDISEENIKVAKTKSRGIFTRCNAEKTPFRNCFFDVIFCNEVMEHFEKPKSAIKEIKRILRKDGKLVIVLAGFPKYTGWYRKIIKLSEKLVGHKSPDFHVKSYFTSKKDKTGLHWDTDILKKYLEQEGFILENEKRVGGFFGHVLDAAIICLEKFTRLSAKQNYEDLGSHEKRLKSPLVRLYSKTALPIIKFIVRNDIFNSEGPHYFTSFKFR